MCITEYSLTVRRLTARLSSAAIGGPQLTVSCCADRSHQGERDATRC